MVQGMLGFITDQSSEIGPRQPRANSFDQDSCITIQLGIYWWQHRR